jgi:hypothetical protein
MNKKITKIKMNTRDEVQKGEFIKVGGISWTEVSIWIVIVTVLVMFSAVIENFIWTIIALI